MYQVNDNENVAYTRNQLQVVNKNEIKPSKHLQIDKYQVEKILGKFKINNKIYYEVLWRTGEKTKEPRSELIKDIPLLIKQFDKSL
jgi:hypothetical protein